MVIAGGSSSGRHTAPASAASTEPAMVIAGGHVKARKEKVAKLLLQRSRRW